MLRADGTSALVGSLSRGGENLIPNLWNYMAMTSYRKVSDVVHGVEANGVVLVFKALDPGIGLKI